MKIYLKGQVIDQQTYDTGHVISFVVPTWQLRRLGQLEHHTNYDFTISDAKGKKSLNQNNMVWHLIGRIAKQENIDKDDLYIQLIEMAEIKTIPLAIKNDPEILEFLKTQYRHVEVLDESEKQLTVNCYLGLSQFNTDEANIFIEKLLYYAENVGINTSEYSF